LFCGKNKNKEKKVTQRTPSKMGAAGLKEKNG